MKLGCSTGVIRVSVADLTQLAEGRRHLLTPTAEKMIVGGIDPGASFQVVLHGHAQPMIVQGIGGMRCAILGGLKHAVENMAGAMNMFAVAVSLFPAGPLADTRSLLCFLLKEEGDPEGLLARSLRAYMGPLVFQSQIKPLLQAVLKSFKNERVALQKEGISMKRWDQIQKKPERVEIVF